MWIVQGYSVSNPLPLRRKVRDIFRENILEFTEYVNNRRVRRSGDIRIGRQIGYNCQKPFLLNLLACTADKTNLGTSSTSEPFKGLPSLGGHRNTNGLFFLVYP
jgi:hypothetical protein